MVLTGILIAPARRDTPRAAAMADDVRGPPSPSARSPMCPAQNSQTIVPQARDHTQGGGPELRCALGLPTTPTLQAWPGVQREVESRGPSGRVSGNREREGRPLFLSSQTEPAKDRPTPQHPCLLDSLSTSTDPSCQADQER